MLSNHIIYSKNLKSFEYFKIFNFKFCEFKIINKYNFFIDIIDVLKNYERNLYYSLSKNLDYIKKIEDKIIKKNFSIFFKHCSEYGYLYILKWLKLKGISVEQMRYYNCHSFRFASLNGHLDILKWMFKNGFNFEDIKIYDCFSFKWAAHNNHLNVLKFFKEKGFIYENYKEIYKESFYISSSKGSLDSLKWLKNEGVNLFDLEFGSLKNIATNGHLNILIWFKEMGFVVKKNECDFFVEAASNGHINILNWFKEIGFTDIKSENYMAFRLASKNYQVDVLKWFKKEGINVKDIKDFIIPSIDFHDNMSFETYNWLLKEI